MRQTNEEGEGQEHIPQLRRKRRTPIRKVLGYGKKSTIPFDDTIVEETERDKTLKWKTETAEEEVMFTKHLQRYVKEKHSGALHADEVSVIREYSS